MKKLISVLLALFMIFSLQSMGVAAATDASKEAQVLRTLGIIPSAAESSEEITRGQFAAYLASLINVSAGNDNLKFADVAENSKYADAIKVVSSLGAMNGKSEFVFAPDDAITLPEAAKAIISLLGYGTIADYEGGYPTGYLAYASRLDILKGVSSDNNLTVNDALKLVYNSLEVCFAEPESYGGAASYKETDKTFLSDSHGLYHVKNEIVTGNSFTGLFDNNRLPENFVKIGNLLYCDSDGLVQDLLGCGVDFYYEEEAGNNYIRYAAASDKTHITEIEASDLISLKNDECIYFTNEKTVKKTVALSADFIYNGVYTSFSVLSDTDLDDVSVKLIDSNNDNRADTVIINKYVNYYIESVDEEKYSIKDRNTERIISFEEASNCLLVYNEKNTRISFADLAPKRLISVLAAKNGEAVKIYVSNDIMGGTVTEIDKDGFFVDGKYIKATKQLLASKYMPKTGELGAVYIDKSGLAAAFVLKGTQADHFGYLLSGMYEKGLSGRLKIRLMDETGKKETYFVSEKCNVDGVNIRDTHDERLKVLYTDFNAAVPTVTSDFVQQLIMYDLNENGEITVIDTEYMDSVNEDENSLYSKTGKFDATHNFDQWTGKYYGKAFLDVSSGIVFNVLSNQENYNEKKYSVMSFSQFQKEKEGGFVKFYNEDDVFISKVAVNYLGADGGAVNERTSLFLVDYVTKRFDGEDMKLAIHGLYDNKEVSYVIDEETYRQGLPGGREGLKRGDILKVNANSDGEIDGYKTVYNIDNRYNFESGLPYNNNYDTETADFTGTIYKTRDDYFVAYYGWNNLNDSMFTEDTYYAAKGSWAGFLVYDEEKDEVRIGSAADLKPYADYGQEATRVYCRFDYGNCASVVILKLKQN